MARRILCTRIPAFWVEVARQQQPQLRGEPVGVLPPSGLLSSRKPLRDVSEEALQQGVQLSMTAIQAQAICPGLQLVSRTPQDEGVIQELESLLREHSLLVEQ